jgi:hypothetical protein
MLTLTSYIQYLESEVARLRQLLVTHQITDGPSLVASFQSVNSASSNEQPPAANLHCSTPTEQFELCTDNFPLLHMECTDDGIDGHLAMNDAVVSEEQHIFTPVMLNKYSFDILSNNSEAFQQFTGFSVVKFNVLFKFLVPDSRQPFTYREKVNEIESVALIDQLLLTLFRLRQGLTLTDIAYRFNISSQSTGIIFNSWVDYMFLRFGSLSFWPHRDRIIEHMPEKYRLEFPNTIAIIDCTELPIQRPSSLHLQSQCYSEYKSCNTVKGLLAIDPRGSIIFISKLFSGSISDKQVVKESGFLYLLEQLVDSGKLKRGDAIMADKGFDTNAELESLGIKMNIPPKASSGMQMAQGDVEMTKIIASHRVHVERAIARVKAFKLVGRKIQASLFHNLNQIWFVCCFLTNFQDWLIATDFRPPNNSVHAHEQ